MEIIIEDTTYEIEKDEREAYNEEDFKERYTEHFKMFDYIVGDWSYNKLRIKGFYKNTNKQVKDINNFKKLDKYLKEQCAYGCRYFVLKKK